jgi:hypothetical protein
VTSACTGLTLDDGAALETVMTPPATPTVRLLPQAPTLLAVAVNFVAVAGTAALTPWSRRGRRTG